jgi:hypothetical protein
MMKPLAYKRPLAAGLLCLSVVCAAQQSDSATTAAYQLPLLGMQVSEQEQQAILRSIEYGRQISTLAASKNGLPYRRDAHAKATACVRATFSINGGIPEHFQHGVFAKPGEEYKAWLRFSNGDMLVQPDGKADARGMAIKLMGVEGDKIAPELTGAKTQDFIMTNTPAFFNRNIFDYVDDMSYLAKLQRTRWFVSLIPPRLHPKRLYRAIQTVSAKIDTPLQPQYYSMLPYALGGSELKFSAKACPGMRFPETANKGDKDYLTEVMAQQLKSGAACFDFLLQKKVAGANMPIDDATVIWSEKASPFVAVARINIPPQNITSERQMAFCENLSMNPWHGVGQWQPLGSLNRARRLVYNAVSGFRHKQNEVERYEPTNWCLEQNSQCDVSKYFNVTKSTWPLPRTFDPLYRPITSQRK